MPLEIETSIADQLPMMVKEALSKLPTEKQGMFVDEFKRKAKSPGVMLALAIFFPIQLVLRKKTGLFIAYWLTLGGLGFWWIAEIFMAMSRTRAYNEDLSKEIIRDIKIMS
jgi:hypothetical protein